MASDSSASGSATGIHLPTFVWVIVAVLAILAVYHVMVKR